MSIGNEQGRREILNDLTLSETSRDRLKSAPNVRLKIAERLQNVKLLVNWGPFSGKNIFGKKYIFGKKSGNAEKTERGTLWSRPVLYLRGQPFASVPWANGYNLAAS